MTPNTYSELIVALIHPGVASTEFCNIRVTLSAMMAGIRGDRGILGEFYFFPQSSHTGADTASRVPSCLDFSKAERFPMNHSACFQPLVKGSESSTEVPLLELVPLKSLDADNAKACVVLSAR